MNKFRNNLISKTAYVMALVMAWGCMALSPARAEDLAVNVSALISETQKASKALDDILLAWWVPQELWMLLLAKSPNMDADNREKFLSTIEPYMVFLVVDGKIQEGGVPKFNSREQVLEAVKLIDSNGQVYKVLPESEISMEAKEALAHVFPFFARNLGPLGTNLHYAIFHAKDKSGKIIANGFTEGTFELDMQRKKFRWRTPLGPLVPHKKCPITGEELHGGWKYNPWNGAKLD